MPAVLIARSAVFFLLAWEVMAVSAYLLIVFDHRAPEVRRSGLLYLVLTHVGTLALLIMFLLLGRTAPDLRFASFEALAPTLGPRAVPILLLALLGFGIKAGFTPLHVWLPGAHAAAPSHVSAVLSAVMIKMGVYGVLRVLALTGAAPGWLAWGMFGLGMGSAILGVVWALGQHDVKRLLAYSSVENVGLILAGIGLGTLGAAYQRPVVAILGYAGALIHALNHSLFKGLLFLGAGAIVAETKTRQLDRLAGLAKQMPRTAVLVLIGSAAITGLPGLNGLIGEWILARGLLTAGASPGSALRFATVATAALGLVVALALACFVRLLFAVFLGQPREGSRAAHDPAPVMTVPAAVLAAACLALALWPGAAVAGVVRVTDLLPGTATLDPSAAFPPSAVRSLGWLAAAILLAVPVLWRVRAIATRSRSRRESLTWGCAYPAPTPRMQYTATSFSRPILTAFTPDRAVGRARAESGFVPVPDDRVLGGLVIPFWHRIESLAGRLRPLQQGRVTTYLQYIIWTVLLLLGFLVLSARTAGR
jgi:hydrogenase-4 component B